MRTIIKKLKIKLKSPMIGSSQSSKFVTERSEQVTNTFIINL